jgi:hypothetical protein
MTTKLTLQNNTPTLLAILITMRMCHYNVRHIAQWSTPQASLEATGCCHWASPLAVLPRRPPRSAILNERKIH